MTSTETIDEDPETKQETSDYKIVNEGEVTDDFLGVDGIKLPKGKIDDEKIEPEFYSHVFRKVVVESAVSAYHQNSSGIRAFSLPENASGREREFLEENIQKLNVRSDMMIPHGTEILHPGPDLSDPTDLIEHLMETSTSMPYQVLTGTQAGAVTGSETNLLIYYIEVNKRRRGKINDMLMDKLEYLQEN